MSKTCKSCGVAILGLRNQQYCPACSAERRRERDLGYRAKGVQRPLGSSDKCAVCGNAYIVTNGLQKYCPDCAQTAYHRVDRVGGLQYYHQNKDMINPNRKVARRKTAICAWCGKAFPSAGTRSKTCSPECRRQAYNERHRNYRKPRA